MSVLTKNVSFWLKMSVLTTFWRFWPLFDDFDSFYTFHGVWLGVWKLIFSKNHCFFMKNSGFWWFLLFSMSQVFPRELSNFPIYIYISKIITFLAKIVGQARGFRHLWFLCQKQWFLEVKNDLSKTTFFAEKAYLNPIVNSETAIFDVFDRFWHFLDPSETPLRLTSHF